MSPEVEGSEKATRPGGRTFEGGVNNPLAVELFHSLLRNT
jgi:hypothetical protein